MQNNEERRINQKEKLIQARAGASDHFSFMRLKIDFVKSRYYNTFNPHHKNQPIREQNCASNIQQLFHERSLINNQRVTSQVAYNHLICLTNEWNNCFSKYSSMVFRLFPFINFFLPLRRKAKDRCLRQVWLLAIPRLQKGLGPRVEL